MSRKLMMIPTLFNLQPNSTTCNRMPTDSLLKDQLQGGGRQTGRPTIEGQTTDPCENIDNYMNMNYKK